MRSAAPANGWSILTTVCVELRTPSFARNASMTAISGASASMDMKATPRVSRILRTSLAENDASMPSAASTSRVVMRPGSLVTP